MRWVAALIGSVFTVTAGSAVAVTPDSIFSRQALFSAAYATPSALSLSATGLGVTGLGATGLGVSRDDLGAARYVPGQGLVRFTSGEASIGGDGESYVDSIRISTAGFDPRPGVALLRPGYGAGANAQNFDLAYVRDWPQAFSLDAGRLTFDVTPHAGFGVLAGGGRTAEAGALVRLQQKMLKAVGMSQGGRLFLFAGATEQAVNLNLARAPNMLGPDPEDGFVSESQIGVGFQHGVVQASFGYSHQSMRLDSLGGESRIDNRIGLRVAIH